VLFRSLDNWSASKLGRTFGSTRDGVRVEYNMLCHSDFIYVTIHMVTNRISHQIKFWIMMKI